MKANQHPNDDGLYFRAKHRAERLRKYYSHLIIFIFINTAISIYKVARNINHGETFKEAVIDLDTFISWIIWGLILLIHTVSVFGLPLILGKHWEEEKIKQFMDEEESLNFKK